MIAIPNFSPKDGLYQIDKRRIHKYKSKGGTVRVYDLIEIIQCGECIHHDDGLCHRPKWSFAVEPTDFCSYGERRTDEDENV